jgi:predicted O-linked N-acetylglucosamine transferase (SPINDLY family)
VSADLNDHPVMRYLLPALRELRARGEFRLVAYNNSLKADAVTGAYQRLFHEWRGVHHLTDEALASQVRTDGIDILFDLSGHTGYNRMLTFARRPAPVQVSWIGYPATTGMEAMDYFVADHFLVSAEMRQQFSERILDVPATTNFEPLAVAPEVNALPALTNGYVTFASLARTNKMNRPVVAAWAEILRRAPTARLMLATMANGEPPAAVQEWFAAQGIAGERLEFVHPRSVEEVLALHHRIDMALDTFPYNGSTGNAHALWMGVPTVALEGGTAPGRMGSGLARHAGLDEFVAADVEGYIRRAVEWAERPTRLAEIRAGAREAFRKSALMQTRATVRVLSAKLREAWRRWCRGLAAESF